MNKSPIVEEIRACREAHARSCGYDLDRILKDIRLSEQKLREEGWTVVAERAEMKPSAASKQTP
ncbi:MAG TPA: hypothetical protein PLO62_11020 [Candidatus Hydrogenedentes bacterium]|nr:hypothetical protein [Candidatus Hydrogenedentota bacterium]HOS01441.1 hypothetical protein [Candidatus Hydrogenedentota bacterium]